MDPNTANLDPKLKEMYDKVMSTPVSPVGGPPPFGGTPPPAPMQPAHNAFGIADAGGQPNQTPPQMPAPAAPIPSQPQEPMPTPPAPMPEYPQAPIQSEPTTQMHAAIPMPVAPKPVSAAIVGGSTKKKGGSIFSIILALGGIIFLGVYSVFWIKFFNLKVPFLPF